MQPSPRSLIVDLLSTLPRTHRGAMPVRAIVAAGRHFGLAENSLRVALARLHAAGTVDRDERGRYRLGARTEATRREVAAWKTRHEDVRPWSSRGWIGVMGPTRPRSARKRADRRERALLLLGFHRLHDGLHLRPDNLAGGVARTRERLLSLDPTLLQDDCMVASLGDLDAGSEERAMALFDGQATVRAYAFSRDRLAASEARLDSLPEAERMVETFLVGGQVLRQIALDPLLPEEIVPAAEREALVAAMLHYDRLGRACWARFLEGFDVPHLRTPADLRVSETPLSTAPLSGALA